MSKMPERRCKGVGRAGRQKVTTPLQCHIPGCLKSQTHGEPFAEHFGVSIRPG